IQDNPCCDFCGVTLANVVTAFACRDFDHSPFPGALVRYRGAWLACAGCGPLVSARAWPALVARAAAAHRCDRVGRAVLAGLYRALGEALTGALVWRERLAA